MPTKTQIRNKAIEIAHKMINKAIVKKGHKLSGFSHSDLMKLARYMVRQDPKLLKKAEKALKTK